MLKKVAVTGGLACGKSSVCQSFRELGAHVVSADKIVHQLLSPKTSISQQVITLCGKDIIVNGQIDRSLVAKKIFNDQAMRLSLEKLLHPAVLREIEKQYQEVNEQGNVVLFVAEIPLLFEINGESTFDYTIAVSAPHELCRQRFKAASGYDDEEYDKRMKQQLPLETKVKRADFVIENRGSLTDLYQAVAQLYKKIVNE